MLDERKLMRFCPYKHFAGGINNDSHKGLTDMEQDFLLRLINPICNAIRLICMKTLSRCKYLFGLYFHIIQYV